MIIDTFLPVVGLRFIPTTRFITILQKIHDPGPRKVSRLPFRGIFFLKEFNCVFQSLIKMHCWLVADELFCQ